MKKDSILRIGLGILGIMAGLAILTVYQAEKISKHEHDWRLKSSPFFQDLHPGGRAGKG